VLAAGRHLQIGSLLFEGLDQIDLTGPFEVLSALPDSTYRIYGVTGEPVRDLRGLVLTPDARANALAHSLEVSAGQGLPSGGARSAPALGLACSSDGSSRT
jgi:cyclohexyl-isocyanide hydratase